MRISSVVPGLLILALAAAPAFAHGGQPRGGSGGPGSGGGGGGGPTTGGGGGGGGPTTGGGGGPMAGTGIPNGTADPAGADGAWETWWSFNKDQYLRIGTRMRDRSAPRGLTGTPEAVDPDARKHLAEREAIMRAEIVPILIDALGEKSYEIRTAAAIALGRTGDLRALPVLSRAADKDDHKDVRESAILGLGLLGKEQPLAFLDERLRDESLPQRTRSFAAYSIGLIGGDEGTAALLRFVESGSPASRRRTSDPVFESAVVALGFTNQPAAAPALREMIGSPVREERTQAFAMLSLARLGDRASLPAVTARIDDPDSTIRRAATIAAGFLATPQDTDTLDALEKVVAHGSEIVWRNFATMALGRCADERRMKILRGILDGPDVPQRSFAALALGIEKDAGSLPILRRLVGESANAESERGAFAMALGLADDAGSRPYLEKEAARHASVWSAGYAAIALGMLRSTASAPTLRATLDASKDPRLRGNVGLALGLLHDEQGIAWLRSTLTDGRSIYERGGAAMALGQLRDVREVPHLVEAFLRPRENELVRALHIVALGVLADPADVPRLSVFRIGTDYMTQHDALDEAGSIY